MQDLINGGTMTKKKCFKFIVKNIESLSLRLAIAKLIPDELDVRADNLPDGSVRVMVKGHKQEVKKFWKALQKQVLGKEEKSTSSKR